jgi:menaquinone-specific isochorismate synthase
MQNFLEHFAESGALISLDHDRVLVGWGKRQWMAKPENEDHPFFYFPDFFLSSPNPWFIHEHWTEITIDELIKRMPVATRPFQSIKWDSPYQSHFRHAVKDLQVRIAAQELKKAVPYVFDVSPQHMEPSHLIYSLHHLLKTVNHQPLFVYGFWEKGEGLLGATPEILFHYQKKNEMILATMACAGTQKRNSDAPSLLSDAKELNEHQLVVQGITESLSPYGKVKVGNIKILELPTLKHLVTPIEVKLDVQPDFEAVVRALHPTPALGAFPRHAGEQWLYDYQQKVDRRRYGAPAGLINKGGEEAICLVAIRNLQWNERGLAIGAGCGVVKESQLDKEWQEVRLKINSIKEMLAL